MPSSQVWFVEECEVSGLGFWTFGEAAGIRASCQNLLGYEVTKKLVLNLRVFWRRISNQGLIIIAPCGSFLAVCKSQASMETGA